MNSLSSKCREEANSTDCLLRAIINFLEDTQKENDAKFEWDPITFGFTVSIALLAAGFALITIIQAVLVAGPGRRKSNSEAIGKWSKYTKRKWQLWDLGYLHVAKTPILTIENVLAYLELNNKSADNNDKSFDTSPKDGSWHSSHRSKSLAASAAKWFVFLDGVGLSHLELPDGALETWLADYLPGDLLAVPALVELRFIYIFMSLSYNSFRVLGTDSRYPVLMGKDFQFEVRQHPTLGSVATFSRYHQDSLKTCRGRMSPTRLSLIAEQAQGLVPVSTAPKAMERDTPDERKMKAIELAYLKAAEVVNHIDLSYQTRQLWLALIGHWSSGTFKEASHKHGQGRHHAFPYLSPSSMTLFALMFADIPKAVPEIFPQGKLDFRGTFEALSISATIIIKDMPMPYKHLLGLVFSSNTYKYQECPLDSSSRNPLSLSTCRCQQILSECKRILQNCDTPGGGTPGIAAEELLQFRNDVISMLLVVEFWLRCRCLEEQVRCAKFSIFSETTQLQHIAKFLRSNKSLSLGLSLFDFLQYYRGYVESGTDDEFMWRTRDEGEHDAEEFRQLLRALETSSGIEGSLVEDLKKDPSLDGLIPISAVWPSKSCSDQEVSLDPKFCKFDDNNLDIDLEDLLNQPRYDNTTQQDNCLIKRVLGWRVLFLSILYMTAFDNTDMLDSGSWNQILPML